MAHQPHPKPPCFNEEVHLILRHVCALLQSLALAAKLSLAKAMKTTMRSKASKKKKKNNAAIITSSNIVMRRRRRRRRRKKRRKNFLRTVALWFSSSDSHVSPVPDHIEPDPPEKSTAAVGEEEGDGHDDVEQQGPCGYLRWLEEADQNGGGVLGFEAGDDEGEEDDDASRIDRLAEEFIASCHEKFRLEKEESYRRYEEMLARGI